MKKGSLEVLRADSVGLMGEVRRLFREYEEFLGVNLCFQGFEAELAELPGKYGPPHGALYAARLGGRVAGCAALRKIGPGVCEMKRLYVRPEFRGKSVGRALAGAVVDEARRLGYTVMRLDTLARLTEAMRLYESMGFKRVPSYYSNPLEDAVYWELDLTEREKREGGTEGDSGGLH